MTRRELAKAMLAATVAETAINASEPQAQHSMGDLKYTMPTKPEEIVMLIYPGMTALDLIGPQQVLGYTMGAKVNLVWKTKEPVVTDTAVSILPSMTFAESPASPDILFVPGGGIGMIAMMKDPEVLAFLRDKGKNATLVTSVCSGALILGAAGLLRGYKATTHWSVKNVLPLLGATPVDARVVEDRNRITAAGISSGIDFALHLAGKLRGQDYGKGLELTLEYDPQPPFGTGSPAKAGAAILSTMQQMYQPLGVAARNAAAQAVKL